MIKRFLFTALTYIYNMTRSILSKLLQTEKRLYGSHLNFVTEMGNFINTGIT